MPVDRLRPRYSLRSMACLLRIAPSSYHYHHARIGVDKYAGLRARVVGTDADGGVLCRAPAFDVSVHAQKESPYATASQNELARQLYQLGVFNPAFAQQADRAADRGLGIAHVLAHVDGADVGRLAGQHQNGFQIHLAGFLQMHFITPCLYYPPV